MKRYLALAILILVTLGFSSTNAYAQERAELPGSGFYVGGHLGLSFADGEVDGVASVDYGLGFSLGGVLGYDFGIFRVDGELAFRHNEAEKVGNLSLETADLFGSSADSTTSVFSYMINGYIDLPTGGPLKPFIGGGIGFASVSVDWVTPGVFPFSEIPLADDSDTGFAYQISAGLGYEINPRVTLTFTFRHFATEELQMDLDPASPFGALPFRIDYQSNEINFGARIMFH
jgi:opacity protein-like surface antigen